MPTPLRLLAVAALGGALTAGCTADNDSVSPDANDLVDGGVDPLLPDDAGGPDGGPDDAGPIDAEMPDGGGFGGAMADGAVPDAEIADAEMADAEMADADLPDAEPDLGPPPGDLEDLEAALIDRRIPLVELRFTLPTDAAYFEVRRAASPIEGEDGWAAASGVSSFVIEGEAGAAISQPIDNLPYDAVSHLAVRKISAGGEAGVIATAVVDLTLSRATVEIPTASGGGWLATPTFGNRSSLVAGVGDVDGDDLDDALITAVQYDGFAVHDRQSAVLVGGVSDPSLVILDVPSFNGAPVEQLGIEGDAIGDVNGDGLGDFALIGVQADFSGGLVAVYFGDEDPDALAEADVLIPTPGRFVTRVTGAGNFIQRAEDDQMEAAYDDLLIGGAAAVDGSDFVYAVAGRPGWPASLEIGAANAANGVHHLTVAGAVNAGAALSGAGDLDGDGLTEIAFSGSAELSFGQAYVFYGGRDLPGDYSYAAGSDDTVQLTHPCPGNQPLFGSFIDGGRDLTGDGDGLGDLMVGDRRSQRLVAFDQDLDAVDCFGNSSALLGVFFDATGDFDGDGVADVITSQVDPQRPEALIFVNDGAGRFGLGDQAAPRRAQLTLGAPALRKLGVAAIGDVGGDPIAGDAFAFVVLTAEGALSLQILR